MSVDPCLERSPSMRRSCDDINTLSHLVSPKRRKLDLYSSSSVFRKYKSSVVLSGSAQETLIHCSWCEHFSLFAQVVKIVTVLYKVPILPENSLDVDKEDSVWKEMIEMSEIGSRGGQDAQAESTEIHPKLAEYTQQAVDYGMDQKAYLAMLVEYEQVSEQELSEITGTSSSSNMSDNDSFSYKQELLEPEVEYKFHLRSADGKCLFSTVIADVGGVDDKGSLQGWNIPNSKNLPQIINMHSNNNNNSNTTINTTTDNTNNITSTFDINTQNVDINVTDPTTPLDMTVHHTKSKTRRIYTPTLCTDPGFVQCITFHPTLVRVAIALHTGSVLIIDPVFPAERGITGLIAVTYIGSTCISSQHWSSLENSTKKPTNMKSTLQNIVISNTTPVAATIAKLPIPGLKQAIPIKEQGNPYHAIQSEEDTLLIAVETGKQNTILLHPLYNGWFKSNTVQMNLDCDIRACSIGMSDKNLLTCVMTPKPCVRNTSNSNMSSIFSKLRLEPQLPLAYIRAYAATEEAGYRLYHVFRALHVRWLVLHGVFYRKWLHAAKSFVDCFSNTVSVLPSDIVQMSEENEEQELYIPDEPSMLDESVADLFSLTSPVKQPKTPASKNTASTKEQSHIKECVCGDRSCYSKKDSKVDACYILRREMLTSVASGVTHPVLTTFFAQYNELKSLERNFTACIDISTEMEGIVTSQLLPLLMTVQSEGALIASLSQDSTQIVQFISKCMDFITDITATRSFFNDFLAFWKAQAMVAQASEQVDPVPMRTKGLKMLENINVSKQRGFIAYCMDGDGGILGAWFGTDTPCNSVCPLKLGAAWLDRVFDKNQIVRDNNIGKYSEFYATETEHEVFKLHEDSPYQVRSSIYTALQSTMNYLSQNTVCLPSQMTVQTCTRVLSKEEASIYVPSRTSSNGRIVTSVAGSNLVSVFVDSKALLLQTSGPVYHVYPTNNTVLIQYNTCTCGCVLKSCDEATTHVFSVSITELVDAMDTVQLGEVCDIDHIKQRILLDEDHASLHISAKPMVFLPSSTGTYLLSVPQPIQYTDQKKLVLRNTCLNKNIFSTALTQLVGNRTDLLSTSTVLPYTVWWNCGQAIAEEGSNYGFYQFLYELKKREE